MKKLLLLLLLPLFSFGQNCVPTTIVINLDQYQSETSWGIYDSTGALLTYGSNYGSHPDYAIITEQRCLPIGPLTFTIYDSYGDGLAGSMWGGLDGSYYLIQCNDTLVYGDVANFGLDTSHAFGSDACPPVMGCMDPLYVEFNPLADTDDGSCTTLVVFGCTDVSMYNWDPLANTMALIPNCDYVLTLYDLVGDGWVGSDLEITQDTNVWHYSLDTALFSNDYTINLNSPQPVSFKFTVTSQASLTASHCGFKLTNPLGQVMIDIVPPFIQPGFTHISQTYCGNLCVEKIYGCTLPNAINYDSLANTDDVSCYYDPGCTSPAYLEYYTQGFVADYDDGSCVTAAVWGCVDSSAFNYNPLANIDNGGCVPVVMGCMQPLAFNYNPQANTSDTCIAIVYGCMSSIALNYNPLANTDDGSCIGVVYGCTDTTAFNYSPSANADDGSCVAIVYGCMDPTMFNYNILANTDNSSCISFMYGCMDTAAFNYDPLANTDNGSCIAVVYGCTNPIALNYDATANIDDGSCVTPTYGCTDSTMFNYNPLANTDNGSCIAFVYGCTNPNALNYDPLANTDDLSCLSTIYGCMDSTAFNYNPLANFDNGVCIDVVLGCTDPSALNYNPLANTDDFSCILPIYGCMDSLAFNYNSLANVDNGSCLPIILGCTDPIALNYCDSCNTDDFSCVLPIYGCTDSTMFNYNPLANVDNSSCIPFVFGCTDPTMLNYDALANTENFTCIPFVYGCMDSVALNYDPLANTDNESCITIVEGCMELSAYNYNSLANVSDSVSCLFAASCATGPGNPYWLNDPCYAWVISIDDYCCDNEWDEVCQSTYDYCEGTWVGPILSRKLEDNIIVYPNPLKDKININKNVDINVFNSIGDMIISETNINVLDVTILTPGIYTLQMTYNNKIINKRIIKQ